MKNSLRFICIKIKMPNAYSRCICKALSVLVDAQ